MFNFLFLTAIYAAHAAVCHLLKGLKNSVASGIDFSLTGAFLAGYWFGWKWGFIIGCVFALTNNLVQMEFYPSMLMLVPMTGAVAIWGSFMVMTPLPIMTAALIGVLMYIIVTDIGYLAIFGERDFVMMASFALGSLVTNWIFFDLFF